MRTSVDTEKLFREVEEFNDFCPIRAIEELEDFVEEYATSDDERVSDALKRIRLLFKEIKQNEFDNQPVKVTCYGRTREFKTRKEAIDFYRLCWLSSEGSEHTRYDNILFELNSGYTECSDGEEV